MAFHLNRLIPRGVFLNSYVKNQATRTSNTCLLSTSSLNSQTQSFNQVYKPQFRNIKNSKPCLDPRLTFTAHQSTDSTSLQEQKEVMNVTPKDQEYDKLFRSVEVECRGVDKAVLKSYFKFVATVANHLEITLEKVDFPKHHIQRWIVLKSVHVHKKHRVQYEVRTHFLIMRFLRLTSSTADTFLEYIQRNLPEGVSMKVTKEELQPLPEHVKGSDKVANH